ncbi:hypothetical protein E4656_06465 [Natronospirillum operosum]|uniref:Uncharacterized protein n=1 Tax=Natronospirillum operosum TaxID=2759953 RepID=A0A4Z0W716_9GAMM|nr:hypothetical protein [Natronospirillum operosum]TGG93834.1 hypothetical protein E4656_06465 [Natronospirillum operosum]
MAGRFDPSSIIQNLQGFSGTGSNNELPSLPARDNRTRAEVREDFDKELEELDFAALEELKEKALDATEPEGFFELKDDLENSLVKFLRFYRAFEGLNSEESRKVALKEQELKLEARHDWASKFRLFFFRILASALLVFTLFGIGYIEYQYDWARLPMTKYFSPTVTQP